MKRCLIVLVISVAVVFLQSCSTAQKKPADRAECARLNSKMEKVLSNLTLLESDVRILENNLNQSEVILCRSCIEEDLKIVKKLKLEKEQEKARLMNQLKKCPTG